MNIRNIEWEGPAFIVAVFSGLAFFIWLSVRESDGERIRRECAQACAVQHKSGGTVVTGVCWCLTTPLGVKQ